MQVRGHFASSVGRIFWSEAGSSRAASDARFKVIELTRCSRRKVTELSSGFTSTAGARWWCCAFDEKSQIQALDRTQPGLPPQEGPRATMTHLITSHGTTHACSRRLECESSGRWSSANACRRHRAIGEFLRFFAPHWTRAVLKPRDVHVLVASTTTPPTRRRGQSLAGKTPRFKLQFFTPTSGVVAEPRRTVLRRDHVQSVSEGAVYRVDDPGRPTILRLPSKHNAKAKPFTWTKTAKTSSSGTNGNQTGFTGRAVKLGR